MNYSIDSGDFNSGLPMEVLDCSKNVLYSLYADSEEVEVKDDNYGDGCQERWVNEWRVFISECEEITLNEDGEQVGRRFMEPKELQDVENILLTILEY